MASPKRLRDWGRPPARSAELTTAVTADPEPVKRPPGRKDTREWCRGKVGVPHQPAIVKGNGKLPCRWAGRYDYKLIRRQDAWSVGWSCWHHEECSACGKILRATRHLNASECPAYPGRPEQRAQAEREAAAYPAQWRAAAAKHRKPPVTGPQGYRRKR